MKLLSIENPKFKSIEPISKNKKNLYLNSNFWNRNIIIYKRILMTLKETLMMPMKLSAFYKKNN